MAEVQVKEHESGRKRKRQTVRVDMTPMVDLGFLMISFFMFTTNFTKPNVIDLSYPPKNDGVVNNEIDYRNSITFILGKDGRVFYYQDEKKNLNETSLKEISFDKFEVAKTIESARDRAPKKQNFTILIKPSDDAPYKAMVDMLDELAITKSERYGIADLNDKEKDLYAIKVD